ncbi:MAG: hypothetical protein PUI48_07325 [Oscillospiraceae bacterium]|nr:hypothetical protein [Oscillospiraceae bacterium]MDY6208872.1 hypothetical protein [Oscillospiraceae bacterium]
MKLKNIFCTIFAAFFLLAFSGAAAFADVLVEPDNKFYRNVSRECEYIEWRSYEVLEDSDLLESPLDRKTNGSIKSGETVQVGFTYTDHTGEIWGCCSFFDSDRQDGWVKMTGLSEIYSVFTFLDEHESELKDYSGELDEYIPKEKVVLWNYPFSEGYVIIKAERWYTRETYPFTNEIADKCWTDENGNIWIYSGRWAAKLENGCNEYWDNFWVFLPAPEATDLSSFGYDISANEGLAVSGQLITEQDAKAAYNSAVNSLNSGRRSTYILPLCLSLGAASISAVMIKLMKKKN